MAKLTAIELAKLKEFSGKLSIKERKSFVNGFNLPVPVILDGDVFFHQICTINSIYSSLEKLKMLMDLYETGNDYGSAKAHAIQSAIQDVKTIPGFDEFNRKAFDGKLKKTQGRKTLSMKRHISAGVLFLWIWLMLASRQLNFQNPDWCSIDCDNYLEFISRYTEHDALRKSKTIAHLIFSGLNSNLQQEIQFHIMYHP